MHTISPDGPTGWQPAKAASLNRMRPFSFAFPLSTTPMFKNLQPLDSVQHRQLRFDTRQRYQYAAQEMAIPLVASELAMAAREYPIVFSTLPGQAPSALVGWQRGSNAHVRADGRWLGRYVPAHVRRYPFQLVGMPHDEAAPTDAAGTRQLLVAIDADAPQLGSETGERLFDDEGQPTPVLAQVQKVLANLQADLQRTQVLSQQLEDAGLLQAQSLRLRLPAGRSAQLEGLRVVNAAALAQLGAEQLQQLNRSGALQMAYAQLASMTNLEDGLLAAINQGAAEVQINDNALDFSGIDWSRLQ